MKNRLLSLGVAAALTLGNATEAATPQKVDFQDYVTGVNARSLSESRQWHHGVQAHTDLQQMHKANRIVTSTDVAIGPTSYWGSVYLPSGEEWLYTCEYEYEMVGEEFPKSSITKAHMTLYDSHLKAYRTFTADFALKEHETTINMVQISPLVTKKFFDINDDYEVMVYVHATTDDYTGHSYTQVYTLADGSLITTLEGNCIGNVNLATDPWSEKYTLLFMREETIINDEDYAYYLHFDVYSKAGWSTGSKLEHTFDVDYSLVSGAGNYALPILMNENGGKIYYALPYYEQPYFVSNWSEDITPDNTFIIDLYDSDFELIKTTRIPMALEGEAIFSFPGIGELNGFSDMTFGVYNESEYPAYIVGIENYIASTDDFTSSLYVYDADGQRIATIVENADDYMRLSDVIGHEQQYCFYFADDETGGYFKFIDIPSCTEGATIYVARDGSSISTSLDRIADGEGYKYVSSLVNGFAGDNDDVIHKFAWFDQSGEFTGYTSINLGPDVVMALPYVASEAFDPHLFDTSDGYEFMFLVKEYISSGSSRTKESLRVYTEGSEKLLDLGPNDETGEYLSSIFLFNPTSADPKLVVGYNSPDGYFLHPVDLPLEGQLTGMGTEANPYVITNGGQMRQLQKSPSAYYVLGNDISMNYVSWTGNDCDFTGVLDGQGHTISNINLVGHGIFGSVSGGGEVKNLNIKNVKMRTGTYSGVIANTINGGDKHGSSVKNVKLSNVEVIGEGDVEFGVISSSISNYSTIEGCCVTGAHLLFGNTSTVGGIVGRTATSAEISNCVFDGDIEAQVAGGIAGQSIRGDEKISDCHAHAYITASDIAGGIIGYSSRTLISNCYVDGEINAVGLKTAHSGGIAGEIKATYEDQPQLIIDNCIVSAKVAANEQSASAVAHRVAGFTSGDELLVDWESKDPSVDWTDPSTYPYISGKKESKLGTNYAYNVGIVDPEVADDPYSTEGKTITIDELTETYMAEHNWRMGNDADSPWRFAGSLLALYTESFALTTDKPSIKLITEEQLPLTVTYTCESRYAEYIKVASSDESVLSIDETKVSDDGYNLICTLRYIDNGECDITATIEGSTAVCHIEAAISSTIAVESGIATLVFDGNTLSDHGNDIAVYDIAGKILAKGKDAVSVRHLSPGVYIAVSGDQILKFKR